MSTNNTWNETRLGPYHRVTTRSDCDGVFALFENGSMDGGIGRLTQDGDDGILINISLCGYWNQTLGTR